MQERSGGIEGKVLLCRRRRCSHNSGLNVNHFTVLENNASNMDEAAKKLQTAQQ